MSQKHSTINGQRGAADERHPFGINYRWTGQDGMICTGRTVAFGKNRAQAERRFFNQQRHVMLEMEAA